MAVGGQRGCNVVVGGGQRRGNSIGGSKRSNNIGHSSVVGGAVVAGDGVAGKGMDNWGNNVVVVVSGQRGSNSSDNGGSNSSDKWGGNMAEMTISSIGGGSIRAIDEGRVSLSFSLTLGNVVRVGTIGTIGTISTIVTIGGDILSMSNTVFVGEWLRGELLLGVSISSGFRLSHGSGGKSENYKHLHSAGGCFETFQGGLSPC